MSVQSKRKVVEVWVMEVRELTTKKFFPYCGTRACYSKVHAQVLAEDREAELREKGIKTKCRIACYRRVRP
jgi:hypothetical protein